jgi:hypothetical protein
MTIKNVKDRFLLSFNRMNIAEKPEIVDWLLFGIVALFAFASFLYGDIRTIGMQSAELAAAFYKGRFFDYYQYSIEASTRAFAGYDVLIFIIFAIWNFPLYIIKMIFNADIFTPYPCLLWLKLMLLFFSAGSAYVLYKICILLNIKKDIAKWAVFLFFTSAYFFIPVLVIAQCDIICLFFILSGFYFYLRNNAKLFLIFFAVAVPLKFFPLFIFIPLVLLKEKNILRIVINCGLVFSLLIVLRLLFHGHSLAGASQLNEMVFGRMTTSPLTISSFAPSLPVFLTIFVLVCAYCYFKNIDPENKNKIASYVCLFVYLTLSMTITFHPYWILFVSPFAILVIVQNLDKLKLNLLLDTGGMLGLIIWQTQIWYWVYSTGINFYEIGTKLWPISDYKYGSISHFFNRNGLGKYIPIFYALYIGCSIAFLILNFPRKDKEIQQNQKFERGLVLTRFGVPVLVVVLLFFIFCIPADQTVISTIENPAIPSPISLDNPSVIKQELIFEQDLILEELQLFCYKSGISERDLYGSLIVSLFEDKKMVFTSRMLFLSIPDSSLYTIDMRNTKIKANKKYELHLGVRDRVKVGFNMALVKFPVLGDAMPLYINGKKTDMNLYFKLTARPFHKNIHSLYKEALVKPNAEISDVKIRVNSIDYKSIAAAVTVKNTGESAWNGKTVYLAAQRESDQGWCGNGYLLPADIDIKPGEEVIIYLEIEDDLIHSNRYRFIMIDNSDGKFEPIGIFSEYYHMPLKMPLKEALVKPKAEISDVKIRVNSIDYKSIAAAVTVKNTGESVWNGKTVYLAAQRESDQRWCGNGILPVYIDINPGEEVTIYLRIEDDPIHSNRYRFIMIDNSDGKFEPIGIFSEYYHMPQDTAEL